MAANRESVIAITERGCRSRHGRNANSMNRLDRASAQFLRDAQNRGKCESYNVRPTRCTNARRANVLIKPNSSLANLPTRNACGVTQTDIGVYTAVSLPSMKLAEVASTSASSGEAELAEVFSTSVDSPAPLRCTKLRRSAFVLSAETGHCRGRRPVFSWRAVQISECISYPAV